MNGNNTDVRRLTELALLTAAALIMFVVELQLPPLFPIYGAKLGLANIITVYCVYKYSPKEAGLVTAVRVILGAVFASSFSTILPPVAFLALSSSNPSRRRTTTR